MNNINPKHKDKIISMLKDGKSISEIGRTVLHSTGTGSINNIIIKLGIHPEDYNNKYLYMNREWLTKAIEKYETPSKIAKIYGMPRTSVTRYAERFELYKSKFNRTKKNNINEDYFKNINTCNKSYWLGFVMADGCLCHIGTSRKSFSIMIKTEDKSHVMQFAKDIDFPEDKIKTRKALRKNTIYSTTGFTTSNKIFCNNLEQHGIIPRKTGKESIPKSIPQDLKNDFIRGFFDGDGHIGFDRIEASTTSLTMLEQLTSWLCNHRIFYTIQIVDKTKSVILYRIVISKQSWKDFLDIVYYPGCFGLERKINKVKEIQSTLTGE